MTLSNTVLLSTPRLHLNGLTPEDMDRIFTTMNKAEIMQLLGHKTEEEFEKEADKQKKGYAAYNRTFILFLLEDKASGKIVGRAGLHNWNKEHFRAELGYVMHDESFRKQGLMSEAVAAIIDYGFRELKLNRIEALVGPHNTASLRIVEKNGFEKEGVMKKHFYVDGVFHDSVVYGLVNNNSTRI